MRFEYKEKAKKRDKGEERGRQCCWMAIQHNTRDVWFETYTHPQMC